jgi:hypothetical protein
VLGATTKLPPQVADPVAAAFAHTFWWSVAAIMLAFIPTLFLPNRPATPGAAPAPGAAPVGDNRDEPRVAGAIVD